MQRQRTRASIHGEDQQERSSIDIIIEQVCQQAAESNSNSNNNYNSNSAARSAFEDFDLGEDDRPYHVSAIIDRRYARGCVEYLVKWTGYSFLESSWLPRSELTSCAQVVKEYNDSFAQLCASHDEQSFNDERCSVCLLPFDSLAFATKHMCGSIMHQTCVIRCKQIQTDFKCPLCQIHIESNKEFSEGIATFNCDIADAHKVYCSSSSSPSSSSSSPAVPVIESTSARLASVESPSVDVATTANATFAAFEKGKRVAATTGGSASKRKRKSSVSPLHGKDKWKKRCAKCLKSFAKTYFKKHVCVNIQLSSPSPRSSVNMAQ